jgi:hypothetical protein
MKQTPKTLLTASSGLGDEARQAALVARRRILRGGLSVAPVLMASAPRSVMAGTACVPASSFASINASRPDLLFNCSGTSPGYWKNPMNFSQWPSPFTAQGSAPTSFDAVFGAAGGYPGLSLRAVLELQGGGRDALARHIVAALLNAQKGLTPSNVLSVSLVKAVWTSFVTKGYYEPTAGIKWYADSSVPAGTGGITSWLKSTMA